MKPDATGRVRVASVLLTAALASPTIVMGQQPVPPIFDAYVAKAVKDWQVPGLAVAVVRNDSVLFAKGYGVRELGRPEPFDTGTVFAIASATKSFTTAALAMLVDEKKLSWDDPVTKHLPEFQLSDPVRTRELTVRDLVTHRAGMLRADPLNQETGYSRDELVRRMRFAPVASGFRARYLYSNNMYAVAGQVIAAVAGMSWDEFLKRRIFEPLGMRSTVTNIRDLGSLPNVATPHGLVHGRIEPLAWSDLDPSAPSGAINSTVMDLVQWIRMQLAGGVYRSVRLLSDSSIREMRTPVVAISSPLFGDLFRGESHLYAYGLGWFIQDYRGHALIEHGGRLRGARSQVTLFPEDQIGIVVIGNYGAEFPDYVQAITYRIFDGLIGAPDRDWSADLLVLQAQKLREMQARHEPLDAARLTGTHPSRPLDAYAGVYEDSLYGAVEIERHGDELVADWFGPSVLRGRLRHWHLDTFYVDEWSNPAFRPGEATLFSFLLGPDGKASELRIRDAALSPTVGLDSRFRHVAGPPPGSRKNAR